MLTGRRIQLSDLLVDGYLEPLSALAEKAFRENRGLAADASLEDAGFRFKDNRFVLTDNFALDSAGLLFHYNEYEIAAYVYGEQRVVLSYDLIGGLLPREGVLEGVARGRQ